MQSPGWQSTLCVAWLWSGDLQVVIKYGHTWHRTSLLRPGVKPNQSDGFLVSVVWIKCHATYNGSIVKFWAFNNEIMNEVCKKDTCIYFSCSQDLHQSPNVIQQNRPTQPNTLCERHSDSADGSYVSLFTCFILCQTVSIYTWIVIQKLGEMSLHY